MAYTCFATHYDRLTGNVSYPARADYFARLIRRYSPDASLVLDLACGTGSLSAELKRLGFDVIGVDGSPEMLAVAAAKNPDLLFLCQDMAELDLYGTIDATVCALDSLNHITDAERLEQAVGRVALFTAPEGLFVFDVNTVYKHREVLGDHLFFYENEDCCCVWQNEYEEERHLVHIDLDFFVKEGELYRRERESFCERAYTMEELDRILSRCGLEVLAVYGDDSMEPPLETTQRLIYVTRKLPVDRGGIAANNTASHGLETSKKSLRIRRKSNL